MWVVLVENETDLVEESPPFGVVSLTCNVILLDVGKEAVNVPEVAETVPNEVQELYDVPPLVEYR